jgi:hypothetical protein
MDKIEKRKEIVTSENPNIANETFSRILEKKKSNANELVIREALDGNLNLSILMEKGFIRIEIIRFSSGNITSLTNIPQGLKKLIIADNLLEEINLPDSIEYVDITHNLLKGEIDLGRNELLHVFKASYNQITSLKNISENLEKLYCDHNLLRSLNLKKTPKLRVLHCDYNPKLILHDLPDTLIDTRLPEKRIQTEKENKTPKEYLESVRRYFIMKAKYEKELMVLKRQSTKSKRTLKTLPSCNGCSRKVGMIFSGKDQKYMAYCGDQTKPCDWKLVIHRGDHSSFLETMTEMRNNLEETKQNMIQQKMDTLFQYITEQKSADLFKKQLSFFKTNSEMVDKYSQDYLDIYFNSIKTEIIKLKQKKIQELMIELQQHLAEENIEEVVRIQTEKIKPIAKYIQTLTYPLMDLEKDKKANEWILYQKNILLTDLEINHGEPISVNSIKNTK